MPAPEILRSPNACSSSLRACLLFEHTFSHRSFGDVWALGLLSYESGNLPLTKILPAPLMGLHLGRRHFTQQRCRYNRLATGHDTLVMTATRASFRKSTSFRAVLDVVDRSSRTLQR